MTNIYNCEKIKNRIEIHSHYGSCFNGSVYENFCSKREDLRKCRECYDGVLYTEKEIIKSNYKDKNLEQEINNLKITSKKEYENTEKKYKDEEMNKSLEYESQIQSIKNTNEINKIKMDNELNSLDIDISNLKAEFEKLKERYEKEVDYEKKCKLNEIRNEYKLKLIKFQNKKEKEKEKREAEMEIHKKEFECKKELEINDMKNKSLLSQQLIAIFKTTLLNN